MEHDLAADILGPMKDADRFKLLGTYRTPRVRVGRRLTCEVRDCDVVVTGYSDARIPWPVGYSAEVGGRASLIVYGDLARAVRRESHQAVAHWFGVSPSVVTKWRAALGVTRTNPGSARLRAAVATDPDRRQKIAEAKRGKPRPAHVVAAVRKANRGGRRRRRRGRSWRRPCGSGPRGSSRTGGRGRPMRMSWSGPDRPPRWRRGQAGRSRACTADGRCSGCRTGGNGSVADPAAGDGRQSRGARTIIDRIRCGRVQRRVRRPTVVPRWPARGYRTDGHQ